MARRRSALVASGRRRVRRVRRGAGLWDWVKGAASTVYNKAIKPAWENKYVSRGLAMISHPYAQRASAIAKSLGGARRRRRVVRKRRVGGRRRKVGGSRSSMAGRLFLV
jgi:hypothetical protein